MIKIVPITSSDCSVYIHVVFLIRVCYFDLGSVWIIEEGEGDLGVLYCFVLGICLVWELVMGAQPIVGYGGIE